MQKTIITILITLIFGLNCYSQVPGYMGHRFSVEGGVNILPSFVNAARRYNDSYNDSYNDFDKTYYSSSNNQPKRYSNFSMNFSKSLSINYSIRKGIDANFRINYSKGNYKLKNRSNINNYDNINNTSNKILSELKLRTYHSLDYNLNFKLYLKNYIAPVGNYFLVGIGMIDVMSTTKINYTQSLYSEIKSENSKLVKLSEKFFKINAGFYKKRFLTEKLYLKTGFEFNFIFLGMSDQRFNDFFSYNKQIKTSDLDDLIDKTYRFNIGRHLALENRLNFKIGLGIIL